MVLLQRVEIVILRIVMVEMIEIMKMKKIVVLFQWLNLDYHYHLHHH